MDEAILPDSKTINIKRSFKPMSDFEKFRSQYPEFIYRSYELTENDETINITYNFEITGLSEFSPQWTIRKKNSSAVTEDKILKNLVFSLGMVELVSYWKITCSPLVKVLCGVIDKEQEKWWKTQYFNGLGEFFYRNCIETNFEGFMKIESFGEEIAGSVENKNLKGCLIPVGGGKDSIVTLDLLSSMKNDSCCYLINRRNSIYQSAYTAGYTDNQIVLATRTLDKNMIRLNSEGFLNGHTPFSAIVAFSAVIAAYINDKKYVVLSNEASANESTVKGLEVNHQYSKSFEFENDFAEYEKKYIGSGVFYFSLLRPLSEFQIAAHFSKLKKFHNIFRSCNVGSKKDEWCGNCSKCLFVSLILSPFISYEEICEIIGNNIDDREDMLETFRQLIGLTDEKPFECVGSREEINFSVTQAIKNRESENKKLPFLWEYYKTTELYKEFSNKQNPLYNYYNNVNNLPENFAEIVKEKCFE